MLDAEPKMPNRNEDGAKVLGEMIAAAHTGNWAFVDSVLAEAVKHEAVKIWAKGSLKVENPDMRDLAASILEKDPTTLEPETLDTLFEMVDTEEHEPARFRATCALWEHGYLQEKIYLAMRNFAVSEDADIATLAKAKLG